MFPCRQIAAVVVAGAQPEQGGSPGLGWAGRVAPAMPHPCRRKDALEEGTAAAAAS